MISFLEELQILMQKHDIEEIKGESIKIVTSFSDSISFKNAIDSNSIANMIAEIQKLS